MPPSAARGLCGRSLCGLSLCALVVCGIGGCGRLGYAASGGPPEADAGMDAGVGTTGPPSCGDGAVQGPEACDDGNTRGGDGCAADCSRREVCGDAIVDGAEACDDGNGDPEDGCTNDCRRSCLRHVDCADRLGPCYEPTCDLARFACATTSPLADGTRCGAKGAGACRSGACAPVTCGDRLVDADEECDDGNTAPADGCENDCTFSCHADGECSDRDPCNGEERCDAPSHACREPAPPPPLPANGAACDRDGNPSTRDICLALSCVASRCGDGYADLAGGIEACDDGNADAADGCENDCSFSCEATLDCDDGLVCTGPETCDLTTHQCRAGRPPPTGTPCEDGGACAGGSCYRIAMDAG